MPSSAFDQPFRHEGDGEIFARIRLSLGALVGIVQKARLASRQPRRTAHVSKRGDFARLDLKNAVRSHVQVCLGQRELEVSLTIGQRRESIVGRIDESPTHRLVRNRIDHRAVNNILSVVRSLHLPRSLL